MFSCDLPTQQGFQRCLQNNNKNKCDKEHLVGVYTAQGEYVGSETPNPWLGYEFIWYNGNSQTGSPVEHCNLGSYNQTKT
jgi:hypothetical protein